MDGTNTRWDTTGRRGFGTTSRLPVPTAYQGWDQLRLAGPMLGVLPADGTVVAVGGDGLVLLDPTTLAVRARRLTGITPSSVALSGDGTRVAVTTTAGKVLLVDPRTWEVAATIPGLSDVAYDAWDENASRLAVVEPSRRRLTVHDATGRTLQTVPLPGEPYQVRWSANRVVTSLLDGRVAVVDAGTAHVQSVRGRRRTACCSACRRGWCSPNPSRRSRWRSPRRTGTTRRSRSSTVLCRWRR